MVQHTGSLRFLETDHTLRDHETALGLRERTSPGEAAIIRTRAELEHKRCYSWRRVLVRRKLYWIEGNGSKMWVTRLFFVQGVTWSEWVFRPCPPSQVPKRVKERMSRYNACSRTYRRS